jgi:hypothetical protein
MASKEKDMKTRQRIFLVSSILLLMVFILANARSVVADPQNFGVRAVRIRSLCTAGFPATPGLPEVPSLLYTYPSPRDTR